MRKFPRPDSKPSFWVNNLTNTNVCLADLALTIPAWRSFNLLDDKHFSYTPAQLEASATAGSLYRKRDKIRISKHCPDAVTKSGLDQSKDLRNVIPRSFLKIEEKNYPELPNTDEKFADEFTEPNE
jgi:hypothetical protein